MGQRVQSVTTNAAQLASALLLVRSTDDLASAIAGANELLRYRRRGASPTRDELLGVWLRRELDADLPVWRSLNPATAKLDRADRAVGVRESFSLSGIWSICWIDGELLSDCETAKERRHRVVDTWVLVKAACVDSTRGNLGVFLPVFDGAQDSESIEEALTELRAQRLDSSAGSNHDQRDIGPCARVAVIMGSKSDWTTMQRADAARRRGACRTRGPLLGEDCLGAQDA